TPTGACSPLVAATPSSQPLVTSTLSFAVVQKLGLVMPEIESTRRHADLIYDVGMHKGEDSDFYLQKGFRVIGFEADPDLIEHCRNRFSREIEQGRLTI